MFASEAAEKEVTEYGCHVVWARTSCFPATGYVCTATEPVDDWDCSSIKGVAVVRDTMLEVRSARSVLNDYGMSSLPHATFPQSTMAVNSEAQNDSLR